jgi:hypothetical protein
MLRAAVKQSWAARLRRAEAFDAIWSYLMPDDRSEVATLGDTPVHPLELSREPPWEPRQQLRTGIADALVRNASRRH